MCIPLLYNQIHYFLDKPECSKTPKICEKHCRETEGSYQCFCDSDETLHENGITCISKTECKRNVRTAPNVYLNPLTICLTQNSGILI